MKIQFVSDELSTVLTLTAETPEESDRLFETAMDMRRIARGEVPTYCDDEPNLGREPEPYADPVSEEALRVEVEDEGDPLMRIPEIASAGRNLQRRLAAANWLIRHPRTSHSVLKSRYRLGSTAVTGIFTGLRREGYIK